MTALEKADDAIMRQSIAIPLVTTHCTYIFNVSSGHTSTSCWEYNNVQGAFFLWIQSGGCKSAISRSF